VLPLKIKIENAIAKKCAPPASERPEKAAPNRFFLQRKFTGQQKASRFLRDMRKETVRFPDTSKI